MESGGVQWSPSESWSPESVVSPLRLGLSTVDVHAPAHVVHVFGHCAGLEAEAQNGSSMLAPCHRGCSEYGSPTESYTSASRCLSDCTIERFVVRLQ